MSASKKKQIRREAALSNPALTEKQKQEQKAAKARKRNVILGVVAAVVAVVLVAALLIWHSGIISRYTTALKVKDTKLSVSDMEYYYQTAVNEYYNQEQYYAQLYQQMGMEFPTYFDPSVPYTEQYVDPDAEEKQTFHDYFLEAAKTRAMQVIATNAAADAANYTLSEDAQKELDEAKASLKSQSQNSGFATVGAYLKAVYGRGMTEKIYMKNLERYVRYSDYQQTTLNAMGDYSDEELNAYYAENPDSLDSYTYHYAYLDGSVASTTDDDGNTVEPTDEAKEAAMAAAKKNAEALLAAVKAGGNTDATSDQAFVDAAKEYTSSETLRSSILGSNNVVSSIYGKWITDEAREAGDAEMFESSSGYIVIEFLSRALDNAPTYNVRHILIKGVADSDDANTTDDADNTDTDNTDADDSTDTVDPENRTMAQAEAEAARILKEFTDGEQTSERFAELAEQYSEDGRSEEDNSLVTAGGLYSDITKSSNFVKPFLDWIFNTDHKVGDTGLVKTVYGWHVMYVDTVKDPAWKASAQSGKLNEEQTQWLEALYEGYEAEEASGFKRVHNR